VIVATPSAMSRRIGCASLITASFLGKPRTLAI
jgi:hypothetical protein